VAIIISEKEDAEMSTSPSRSYPTRQPFPDNVVVSLEGETQLDSATIQGLRTLEMRAFQTTRAMLENYLNRYPISGAALGVQGAYGSGKTHLLTYLLKIALGGEVAKHAVYVKAEGSDFLRLYKRIIDDLEFKTLLEAKTLWLSHLAQKEAKEAEVSEAAVPVLKQNPETVYNFLNRGMLSSERIEGAYQEKVREVAKLDDFLHALSYLQDPLLGVEAFRWFRGEAPDINTLKKLGVRETIDTPEKALLALRFLVTLFYQAELPLLLFIDQIERLVLDVSSQAHEANLGNLHSLLEVFKRECGFICLAGVTEAWNSLPADLFDRLDTPPVTLHSLRLDDTLNLLKVYLSQEGKFSLYKSEEEIFPYTESAAREMLRISNGNIRRILRLGYRTFEEAVPDQLLISDDLVERVSKREDIYFDAKSIHEEIQRMLREANINFEVITSNGEINNLAVPHANSPIALIEVTRSVFTVDEARRAIGFLKNATTLRSRFPRVQLILVVAGYLSREVQEVLKSVVNHYRVFDPNTFSNDFEDILETLKSLMTVDEVARFRSVLDTKLEPLESRDRIASEELKRLSYMIDNMRTSLEEILDQRQQSSNRLASNLQEFSQFQLALENKRIEIEREERDRISASKNSKETTDRNERERLCQFGEKERQQRQRRRIWTSAGFGFGLFLLISTLLYNINPPFYDPSRSGYSLALAFGAAIGFSVFVVMSLSLFRDDLSAAPFVYRAGGINIDLKFLEQDALQLARSFPDSHDIMSNIISSLNSLAGGSSRPNKSSFIYALRDPNPQVRYLAAQAAYYEPQAVNIRQLLHRLKNETWLPAQAAMLRTVVNWVEQTPDAANWILEELFQYLTHCTYKEAVYTIDALQRILGIEGKKNYRSDLHSYIDIFQQRMKDYPASTVSHAMLSGIFLSRNRDVFEGMNLGNPEQAPGFIGYFSACLGLSINVAESFSYDKEMPDWTWWPYRLADLYQERKRDLAYSRREALNAREESKYEKRILKIIAGLPEETLQNAALIFDHGDGDSLGFYENLLNAELYADLYKFFLELRIILEQDRIRSRYSR
jgi:hypothetical protein